MNRAGRIVTVSLIILLLLTTILALTLVLTVRRPYPQTRGRLELPGLQAAVTVRRDDSGIPHIYAENEYDLFFAQGFTHAQDRFWQMELSRHIGQGRLAEIAGTPALETDLFIRNLGWNRMAQLSAESHQQDDPEAWAVLEAYADGVNAYLTQQGDAVALNRTILSLVNEPWEIEPWEPVDTISWGIVMAWQLSGNMSAEMEQVDLRQQLPADVVDALFPPYPADRPVIAPNASAAGVGVDSAEFPVDWQRLSTDLIGRQPSDLAFGMGDAVGSNNWVVSGQYTASGQPLLANDPHLAPQMPSIWYLNGLHAPGWDVTGFSFPGAPGVLIGHNADIAWGVTTLVNDSQDLFIEKLNPDNPLQVEYNGEWRDMETVTEILQVNGAEPVELTVRQTVNGVIMNTVNDELEETLSLRWGALQQPTKLFKAILLLNQAADYADFQAALRYWDIAAQNVVYADIEGNIAYQSTGLIPLRKAGDGRMPVPGWTDEYAWDGWIPYEEMPTVLNPPEGFIVTANNAVVNDGYPYLISTYWGDGDRAKRIVDMLDAATVRGEVSAETMATIQLDSRELLFDSMRPLFENISSDEGQVQAAIERLRGWDGQLRRDSVPAALFEVFYMQLAQRVLADELGAVADDYLVNGRTQRLFFHQLAQTPDAAWWDNVTTDGVESAESITLSALADTIAWFDDKVGGGMNDWTWGSIHAVTFRTQVLGASGIGPIEAMFNRGPYPVDGGESIVNANSFSWGETMAEVDWHPSLRFVVDMAALDAVQVIIPTGQSGHAYHPHYADMAQLWADGAFVTLPFSAEAVEDAAAHTLTLTP